MTPLVISLTFLLFSGYLLIQIIHRLSSKLYDIVYHPLFFIGVVLHEINHLVPAVILGRKIKDISPYSFYQRDRASGYVQYLSKKSIFSGMTEPLISLGPLVLGVTLGAKLLGSMGINFPSIPDLPINYTKAAKIVLFNFLGSLRLNFSLQNLVFGYIFFSLALSWFPSNKDLKNCLPSTVLLAGLTAVCVLAAKNLGINTPGHWVKNILNTACFTLLAGQIAVITTIVPVIIISSITNILRGSQHA